jgi:2-keto-4-pentenoate hydratase/2-oxohepta-3-ene-1,7-dioic acid hydratase in catechol pathway
MKLIRFGETRKEKPGVELPDGERRDLSGFFQDWNRAFFQHGGLSSLEEVVEEKLPSLPAIDPAERLGPCVAQPGKVLCIGLNYADHAAETGDALPGEPLLFGKASTAITGPYDNIVIPPNSSKTDFEIELAVVIGRDSSYLEDETAAAASIAGYCIANDVSERGFQKERGGQFIKGKSCDTFLPLGPYLVTRDEIEDVSNLEMRLDLNGERMQTGNTRSMVFSPNFVVHYLSQFMTLEAGDVICTGTPAGVGAGRTPPVFLAAGDKLTLAINGLGEQRLGVVRCE